MSEPPRSLPAPSGPPRGRRTLRPFASTTSGRSGGCGAATTRSFASAPKRSRACDTFLRRESRRPQGLYPPLPLDAHPMRVYISGVRQTAVDVRDE